jgi:hypothetical protein
MQPEDARVSAELCRQVVALADMGAERDVSAVGGRAQFWRGIPRERFLTRIFSHGTCQGWRMAVGNATP